MRLTQFMHLFILGNKSIIQSLQCSLQHEPHRAYLHNFRLGLYVNNITIFSHTARIPVGTAL